MKTLKFLPNLVKLILSGEKTTTWRLWDDKNLSVGDEVSFLNSETQVEFAKANLTMVIEKQFKELNEEDWAGHEKFNNDEELYEFYSKAYRREAAPETILKIIHFKLI